MCGWFLPSEACLIRCSYKSSKCSLTRSEKEDLSHWWYSGHISVGQPFGMSRDKEIVVVTIEAKQMKYVSYINVPKSNYVTKRCMQTSVADEWSKHSDTISMRLQRNVQNNNMTMSVVISCMRVAHKVSDHRLHDKYLALTSCHDLGTHWLLPLQQW
jgi:hypothetical protein